MGTEVAHAPVPVEDGRAGPDNREGATATDSLSVTEVGDLPEAPDLERGVEEKEKADPFFVEWEEGERMCPWNWSGRKRWALTFMTSLICLVVTFASSISSGAYSEMQAYFHSNTVETTLTTSLFVLGYSFGPLAWAPLSEVLGRRPVLIVTYTTYMIFIIPCALAKNIETVLVSRFIGGVFASSSLTNSGGTVSDLWAPSERGIPFGSFSITPTLGPLLAPIVSSFLASAYSAPPNEGFRPVFWLLFTFSGILWVAFIIFLPETYHPVLLRKKAERLRKETGDERYWARLEREDHSLKPMVQKVLARPLIMICTEPIVLLLSTYLALIYGCIYLFFELYPAIFVDIQHFSYGVGSLPLLGVAIGAVSGFVVFPYYDKKYHKAFVANGNVAIPEERLPPLFISAPLFAISLFWLGWSSDKHWYIPALSGLFTGYSIFFTFQCVLTYLGDVYAYYAASSFAAAQILRSLFGFAFPLFTSAMVSSLGVPWTASLLGFVALALCPVPYVFYKYGKRIRGMSKYTLAG